MLHRPLPVAATARTVALPPGPKVSIVAITQPNRVNTRFTPATIPARTGGRIEVTFALPAGRNLSPRDLALGTITP